MRGDSPSTRIWASPNRAMFSGRRSNARASSNGGTIDSASCTRAQPNWLSDPVSQIATTKAARSLRVSNSVNRA